MKVIYKIYYLKFNMNYKHIILFFLTFFLTISGVFSIGIYDNYNNYKYYTNKLTDLNIRLWGNPINLQVKQAQLIIDNINYTKTINENIAPFSDYQKTINLAEFGVSSLTNKNLRFLLQVFDSENKLVIPKGDPTDFEILISDTLSNLTTTTFNIIDKTQDINLEFTEKIYMLNVKDKSGKVVYSWKFENNREINFISQKIININEQDLNQGQNKFDVDFIDIYENSITQEITINVKGDETLTIKLLTREDNPELSYYFNKNYLDFFGKTIYVGVAPPFEIFIETNKPSICYYSISLGNFKEIWRISELNKNIMTTSDFLTHSVKIDNVYLANQKGGLYIACENKYFPDEDVYLSKEMGIGESLIKIQPLNQPPLEIVEIYPKELITSEKAQFSAITNNDALCFFNLNNLFSVDMIHLDEADLKKHNLQNLIEKATLQSMKPVGERHNVNINCLDKLGYRKSQDISFIYDPTRGIKVIDYNPKYSADKNVLLDFIISQPAVCYLFQNQRNCHELTSEAMENNRVTGEDVKKKFVVNNLAYGDNHRYICCPENSEANENIITIIMDDNEPKLENFTLLYDSHKVMHINSNTSFEYDVDVISLIPIDRFIMNLYYENKTKNKEFKTKQTALIKENLEGLAKIKLTAFSLLNKSGEIIRKATFDFLAPNITISTFSKRLVIDCKDTGSTDTECIDVSYGFSFSEICAPTLSYNSSQNIEIGNENYICAKAYDISRNKAEILYELNLGEELNPVLRAKEDVPFEAVMEQKSDILEDDETLVDEIPTEVQQNFTTIIIILVLAVLLFSIIGGGYYLWHEGLLDKYIRSLMNRNFFKSKTTNTKLDNFLQKIIRNKMASEKLGNEMNNLNNYGQKNSPNKESQKSMKNKISGVFNKNYNSTKSIFNHFNDHKKVENEPILSKKKPTKINLNSLKDDANNFEKYYKEKKTTKKE